MSLTIVTATSIIPTISRVEITITGADKPFSTHLSSAVVSTHPLSPLTVEWTETEQKTSSPATDRTMVTKQSELSARTAATSIMTSKSNTLAVESTTTTTMQPKKSEPILLYTLFGLLMIIIGVTITSLIIVFLYCGREQQHSSKNDPNIALTDAYVRVDDQTNRLENSSKASSSLSSIQHQKDKMGNRPNMVLWRTFIDSSF